MVRSVGAFLVADGLGIVSVVLFSIVLARTRGADELGVFSFSMAQALLLQMFVDANFAVTLAQEVARTGKVAASLRDAQLTKWYLAVVGLPVGIGLTLLVGRSDAVVPTVAAFVIMLVHSFVGSYAAALQGLGKMTLLGTVIAVTSTAGALGGIVALLLGYPLFVVILAQGLANAIPAWVWLGSILRRWEPGWFPWRTYVGEFLRDVATRRLWGVCGHSVRVLRERWYWIAFSFLTVGYARFGVLFLGWMGAAPAVIGAYSAAQRFVVVLRILPNAFFRVLLPQFAREPGRFSLLWTVGVSSAVGIPGAAVVAALAPWLIEQTFRIPEAVTMLQVMGWALPAVMLSHLAEAYGLTFRRYQRLIVVWAAIVLGCGFLAATVAFPQWGGLAVAAIYVGMESLYALGVLGMVGVRCPQREVIPLPEEHVARF
ncbi:MAG: oligosaccharide flippase family protein [Candidatus Kapabacteria bacterium]|nr:oligosaccharide flippase family protein [Candidatus Kapabacteria bacterium]